MRAELHAFYGEVWGGWFNLPQQELEAYLAAIGALRAARQLEALQVALIANPPTDKNNHRDKERAIKELERQANEGRPSAKRQPTDPDQDAFLALSLGFEVERVTLEPATGLEAWGSLLKPDKPK